MTSTISLSEPFDAHF